MFIKESNIFSKWFDNLKDLQAKARINKRILRVKENNNLGDCKNVGEGVFELRIDFGGGYRIYFAYRGLEIILLLCGGDKSSQQKDIEKAKIINKKEL